MKSLLELTMGLHNIENNNNYYLTLSLDFLCPRFLSGLYHKWIYEY